MAIETLLLAVGGANDQRVDEMVETTKQEASGTDTEVVIFHVFDEDDFRSLSTQMNLPTDTAPARLAERNVTVSRIRDKLEDAGISVRVDGAIGDRSDTIVEMADRIEADRIIVGGRKRTPVGKAIFGSTAQSVMMNASCPTTFVRA